MGRREDDDGYVDGVVVVRDDAYDDGGVNWTMVVVQCFSTSRLTMSGVVITVNN